MRPAAAQVAPTLSMPTEPASSAFVSFERSSMSCHQPDGRCTNAARSSSAQSRLRKLVKNATTVAQNTAPIGEKPSSMKTMIATSDRKWKPVFRVSCHTPGRTPKSTGRMPYFRASISTISSSDR